LRRALRSATAPALRHDLIVVLLHWRGQRAARFGSIEGQHDCTAGKDKLLIAMAAMVARRRLERGVKLNHPEAIALISDSSRRRARGRTVAELMEAGAHVSRAVR